MKLLNAREVSEIIGTKPKTVYQWAGLGQIPSFKINGLLRFSEDEVLRWIKNCQNRHIAGYNIPTGRRPRKEGR